MLGLLKKDLFIMKNQLRSSVFIFLIAAFMLFTQTNSAFVISYTTFILAMFSMNTISYDEMDHGYSFLFTLPITRRQYVLSKYLFGSLVTLLAWIVSQMLVCVFSYEDFSLFANFLFLCVAILFLALEIPMHLHFGMERIRIALFGLTAVIMLLAVLAVRFFEKSAFEGLVLPQVNAGMGALFILLFTLVLCTISFAVSMRIINKKSF